MTPVDRAIKSISWYARNGVGCPASIHHAVVLVNEVRRLRKIVERLQAVNARKESA